MDLENLDWRVRGILWVGDKKRKGQVQEESDPTAHLPLRRLGHQVPVTELRTPSTADLEGSPPNSGL